MIKIEAIVREEKLEEIKDALCKIQIHGLTISQVVGCGTGLGYSHYVRGTKVDINVIPKIKFEIVVSDQEWADKTVDAISKTAYTGEHGDGKIFVYEIKDVVRIRTGEHGTQAVWDEKQKSTGGKESL